MSLTSFIAKTGTNPSFIAFMAHTGFAYGVVLTLGLAHINLFLVAAVAVAAAAWKEFYFDARYEVPKQTTSDNLEDFAGYVAGIVLAVGVCQVLP